MSTINYPNDAAPAPHSFTIECPDGWTVHPAPRALMMLTPDEHSPEFHPNLVIASHRVPSSVDLKEIGVSTLVTAAGIGSDAALEVGKVGRLNGRLVYIQTLALTLESTGQRAAQLHVVFYGPQNGSAEGEGGSVADLYTVIGTCLDVDAPTYAPIFLQIAASLTFGPQLVAPAPG